MVSSELDFNIPGREIAVAAEALYLANLMIVPGIAFIALLVLWLRERRRAPELARGHLRQTVAVSLWAGVLLVVANAAIIFTGGYGSPYTWVIVILYFTTCHSTLIFCGAIGLAKALAGKPFRYPLIGPR
ncbi:MAG: DUF4870 domain-containing protein [Proteobacteria bacterium]|nr:DUF4870 domain-containing protein [Pseudomonadota bacterium]